MRTALSVVLTLWPPGTRGAEDVDLEILGLDLDVHFLRLGQHRHRRRRGVDPPLRLGRGHALHAVHPGLAAQQAVGIVAPHRDDRFLDAAERSLAHARSAPR